MRHSMAAKDEQVQELRQQLAAAGQNAAALQGVMEAADEAHKYQVQQLQDQLADVAGASMDLQARISAADSARNRQARGVKCTTA